MALREREREMKQIREVSTGEAEERGENLSKQFPAPKQEAEEREREAERHCLAPEREE